MPHNLSKKISYSQAKKSLEFAIQNGQFEAYKKRENFPLKSNTLTVREKLKKRYKKEGANPRYISLQYKLLKQSQKIKTREEIKQFQDTGKATNRHTFCANAITQNQVAIITPTNKKAFFYGVASCGCIWRCKTCATKLLKARGQNVLNIFKAHEKTTNKIGFITLTIRHNKYQSAKSVHEKLNKEYRKLQNLEFFKEIRKNFLGQIKATEVTISDKNGFHFHLHIAILWTTNDEKYIEQSQKIILQKWAKRTNSVLKAQNQKIVQSAKNYAHYLSKIDTTLELTNQVNKTSKGYSPFQLLEKIEKNELLKGFDNIELSNMQATKWFSEYVSGTKRKRRLTISPAIYKQYNIKALTKNEIFQIDNNDDLNDQTIKEINNKLNGVISDTIDIKAIDYTPYKKNLVLVFLSLHTWKTIQSNSVQGEILKIVEIHKLNKKHCIKQIIKFLNKHGQGHALHNFGNSQIIKWKTH
jgi:hypothetical protein